MAQKQGSGKKKRNHKISEGKRRSSRPVKLTTVQKALLGGGIIRTFADQSSRTQR